MVEDTSEEIENCMLKISKDTESRAGSGVIDGGSDMKALIDGNRADEIDDDLLSDGLANETPSVDVDDCCIKGSEV